MYKIIQLGLGFACLSAASFGTTDKPICPGFITPEVVKKLSENGSVEIKNEKEGSDSRKFSLASNKEANNNYNNRLIETKNKLDEFLEKSNANLSVVPYRNTHQSFKLMDPTKRHCPFTLTKGTEVAVIVLKPESE
jgi:hypothetical protein